ncbi:MAG TPA: alkaline phosphatase family protein, partial [Thermoanaerobaculia bacterium]|nr:alkaline phosphatase family protein [Thermoanaerobaculia bacterium]
MNQRASRFMAAKSLVALTAVLLNGAAAGAESIDKSAAHGVATTTPIKHVVVIFQENVSFDHYFATYPRAANPKGEPRFTSVRGAATPSVNGLTDVLRSANPNSSDPFRLSRAQNYTCDQDHDYTPEQQATNEGQMNQFVEAVGVGTTGCDYGHGKGLVMGYYDGNTVTALWNIAQHFAMSDNSYGTSYGPSTPGAINLVSGQAGGVDPAHTRGDLTDSVIVSSIIGDPDPYYDDCGSGTQVGMTGRNAGDLLNDAGLTWGWFQGGFAPSSRNADGTAVCNVKTPNLGGVVNAAYSAHHQPFQYYASTANPHHLPPTSVAMIGHADQANHQYDLADFYNAVKAHNLPAVSYLKATKSQDGHAGYSSPLDEQVFLATVLNALQQSPEWATTAVIINWDDSDGWYDHVLPPLVNPSTTSADALTGNGACGSGEPLAGIQGRCGHGPRLPMLVVSPYSKVNFVDHSVTDQSSVLR